MLNLTPAQEIGLDISMRWPELAWRVGEAIRLVEAGKVHLVTDNRYKCDTFQFCLTHGKYPRFIYGENVTVLANGYYCTCEGYRNGVTGVKFGAAPKVEIVPGHACPCCTHILAVHIGRQVMAEAL